MLKNALLVFLSAYLFIGIGTACGNPTAEAPEPEPKRLTLIANSHGVSVLHLEYGMRECYIAASATGTSISCP